MFLSDLMDVID